MPAVMAMGNPKANSWVPLATPKIQNPNPKQWTKAKKTNFHDQDKLQASRNQAIGLIERHRSQRVFFEFLKIPWDLSFPDEVRLNCVAAVVR